MNDYESKINKRSSVDEIKNLKSKSLLKNKNDGKMGLNSNDDSYTNLNDGSTIKAPNNYGTPGVQNTNQSIETDLLDTQTPRNINGTIVKSQKTQTDSSKFFEFIFGYLK